ncbi:MAG: hypothetical protein KAS04_03560, partial [Candidatus Aenigmarchaeota archaeon]|nr:hypothetical protein [Candidatus Aenigmarchaeota archaeon]
RNLKQFFDIGVNELKNAIPKAEMLYEKDELDYDGYFPNLFNKIGNYIFAMSVKNNKPKKEVEAKE